MSDKESLLITGGAGYVGSHAVLAFRKAGYRLVVLDDLSTGRRSAVPEGVPFVQGDAGDMAIVSDLMQAHRVSAVVHFAGSVVVPDSIADPLRYYRNNTFAACNLISACVDNRVRRFILSSTAAIYGASNATPVAENAPVLPANPYGTSKLMIEWILRDTAAAEDFRYVALRYFNVGGADPDARTGQCTAGATHLIEAAMQAAMGLRDHLEIFGDDYDTPDGTGVRDYIHVCDLVDAHVLALRHLEEGGATNALNLGSGRGYSVREVIEVVRRVTGRDFPVRIGPHRAGDLPGLVADISKAQAVLDWRPRRSDLDTQVADAWRWYKNNNPAGP